MKLRHVLLALACTPLARATPQNWTPHEVLGEMTPFIEPCVQPTPGSPFSLCYDLHSSIHAHWAAYRISRVRPDLAYLADASYQALEYSKVAAVASSIDYVYAQGWFLLLCLEFEKWCLEQNQPDPFRLLPIANSIADDLLAHYLNHPPNPQAAEYQNPSWPILHLFHWYERRVDIPRLRTTQELLDAYFLVEITGVRWGYDVMNNLGFFSKIANWIHLVVETQPQETIRDFLELQYDAPDAHLQVNGLNGGMVHTYGLGWSRTWGMRSMARHALNPVDRERFWRAANAHIQVGMQRHAAASGNFVAYGHWVPQFAVYAVTEGFE